MKRLRDYRMPKCVERGLETVQNLPQIKKARHALERTTEDYIDSWIMMDGIEDPVHERRGKALLAASLPVGVPLGLMHHYMDYRD